MVKHSDAIAAWEKIFNTQKTYDSNGVNWHYTNPYCFPYISTMQNAQKQKAAIQVVPTMTQLYLYFKHLKKEKSTGAFSEMGNLYLELIKYVPSEYTLPEYTVLKDYFSQGREGS